MRLNEYEKKAYMHMTEWENIPSRSGAFDKMVNVLSSPVDWVMESMVPDKTAQALARGIEGFLAAVSSLANLTVDARAILRDAKEMGLEVEKLDDLKNSDLALLDTLAREYVKADKLMATLEGGGCGMGGAALIAADIPALFMINFRMLQKLCAIYGFDPSEEAEREVMLKVFEVSLAAGKARLKKLEELEGMVAQFKKYNYKQLVAKGLLMSAIQAGKEYSVKLGTYLARRKIAQLVPVVGALVGAGYNYVFTAGVADTGYMIYRKRWLEEKQDRGA